MFGLLLFVLIFVILCLLISKPTKVSLTAPVLPIPQATEHISCVNEETVHTITEVETPVATENPSGDETLNTSTKIETPVFDDVARNTDSSNNNPEDNTDLVVGGATAAGGAVAGAGVSAMVGGMGLVGGFGEVAIGMAPVTAAGTVAGTAFYGAMKAAKEKDASALGLMAGGAAVGAVVSAMVGGMGLAVGGTAVAVNMAPMAIAGGLLGMAGYGLWRMFGGKK